MKKTGLAKKIFAIFVAVSMTVLSISGCGSSGGSSSDKIKIGTSFPMSGSVAADGQLIVNAVKLAAEQVNDKGGINGKKIEVVSEDDEGSPTSASSVANKFAENNDIMGVITSYNSSCCLAQVPVFEEAGLPAISPVSTSTQLTGISDYFYRTCNNDAYVGMLCADYSKKLGFSKVAILYEQDDYGEGIYKEYKKQAEKIGMKVNAVETFVYGETKDFSTIITNLKKADIDGIFFAGLVTEMSLFSSQAKTMGLSGIPIFADEGCNSPAMLAEGGENVEGMYTTGGFAAESDEQVVKDFVAAYNKEFGSDPSVWAALGYDAAMTMFEAMKACGDDISRESINKQLQGISYEGVTGLNKFKNSDVEKEYYIFQVKDGKFTIVEQ